MTYQEFLSEFREIETVFDKKADEVFIKRLFERVSGLTVQEFRAVKTRVLDECEYFPRLIKFVQLKDWILTKRERPQHQQPPRPRLCAKCDDFGFKYVDHNGAPVWVYCNCPGGENNQSVWKLDLPFFNDVDVKVKTFPTSFFVPKNKDDVLLSGDIMRGVSDIVQEWISELKLSASYWSRVEWGNEPVMRKPYID